MNASNTKLILKHALKTNDSVLINGKHGIGKTSVVEQFAAENNMFIETLILSLKDPSDLLGMPNADETETVKRTIWLEPDWFQKIVDKAWPIQFEYDDLRFNDACFKIFVDESISNGTDKTQIKRKYLNELYCQYYKLDNRELQLTKEQYIISCEKSQSSVLFLDELNRAELSTRQCSLQLVLEKELHSHKLPFVNGQRTFIVAAINPSDDYQTEELDSALLDRFLYIDMTLDVNDWIIYAKNIIDESIISFVSEQPDMLHYMPIDNSKGSSPRSWEQLSMYLKNEIDNIESNVVLEGIITGKVGKEVGSLFYVYFKNYKNILKIEDIVEATYKLKSANVSNGTKNASIEDISKHIKELTSSVETIRKHALLNQLLDLSSKELETENYNVLSLTLIGFLSSLNFEISIMFCKKLKSINEKMYYNLVKADEKLNGKKFFTEMIKYSR